MDQGGQRRRPWGVAGQTWRVGLFQCHSGCCHHSLTHSAGERTLPTHAFESLCQAHKELTFQRSGYEHPWHHRRKILKFRLSDLTSEKSDSIGLANSGFSVSCYGKTFWQTHYLLKGCLVGYAHCLGVWGEMPIHIPLPITVPTKLLLTNQSKTGSVLSPFPWRLGRR